MKKYFNTLKTYFNRLKKSPIRKKIGLALLLPAIWSVISFSLITVFGDFLNNDRTYDNPFIESRVQMENFGSTWRGTVDYNDGGGGYTSALPIYIGLMALAGAYLIKD
tara:strand:- start:1146 stop:1469 length:324 start_codon:yes stop_codon:yes gene_type:complete